MDDILLSRWTIGLLGAALLAVGAGFVFHVDAITALWPETSRYSGDLTDLFVGSIFAAIGASVVYGLWIGDRAAAAPGLLALAVLFGTMAITLLELTFSPLNFAAYVVVFVLLALAATAMLVASLRARPGDVRPAPMLGRVTFVGFAVVLIIGSALLMARIPNVFPWNLPPLSSALYGCLFLGVALNYAFAAWRGRLVDAKVPMVGFFLYDLILIVPLVRRFATVPPEQMPSLVFYVFILAFSTAVTFWLFWYDWRVAGRVAARPLAA